MTTQEGSDAITTDTGEKTCPFCAETIKAAAVVCRYCGRDLPTADGVSQRDWDRALRFGIVREAARWVVDGCYFGDLDRAIEFKNRPRTAPPPAAAPQPRRRIWIVAGLTAALLWTIYFFGSRPLSGRMVRSLAEEQCEKDSARARVLMDCKEVGIEVERRFNAEHTCPPEAPDCSWGRK